MKVKIGLVLTVLSGTILLFFSKASYASVTKISSSAPSYLNFDVANKAKILQQLARDIDPKALTLGLKAYQCAAMKGYAKKPILSIVDYSKPSTQKRLWIFDLQRNILDMEEDVTHGQGSGANMATHFSNIMGTHASSLGLYQTANVYQGQHGLSLRLLGLEPGYNDHAYARAIVMHGADYVNPAIVKNLGRLGRSWGCFAVSRHDIKPTINTIKNGSLLFAYYPDKQWLSHSQFLQC